MGDVIYISWIVTVISLTTLGFAPSKVKAYVVGFTVVINALLTSWLAFPALGGQGVDFTVVAGSFLGNIPIRIDGLSAWFILIINFTSVSGVFYGIGYLKAYENSTAKLTLHWVLYILFHLSMIWVCMLQQGFVFLVAWEVMSLTSMLLVIFDHNNPKTLKAGINYLVQMHLSIVFLTIGFVWVYAQTGSFNFEAIRIFFTGTNNIWLFLVFFIGFGLKAGFVPLHTWLPHAHPAAPSHISGVMSGVIVKLGIYGIFRIIFYLRHDILLLGEIMVSLSVLTGLYGILNAAVHRDFKRMLAYCTIENIGIIGIGMGLGMIGMANNSPLLYFLGFGGALLHVLNHSLFKSLLFFSAGSVYQQTHTRDMEKLGGLIKYMPKTAALFLVGAIAIGGIPPFNGFVSEFIIYSGLIEGLKSSNLSQTSLLILTFAGLSIIGGLSILTFTKTFGTIFLGNERTQLEHKPKEVSPLMLWPQYFIVAIMITIAFLPQLFLTPLTSILSNLTSSLSPSLTVVQSPLLPITSTITSLNLAFALLIGFIILMWFVRSLSITRKTQTIDATWGCGYVAPTSKIQYTGKSFSKPLGKAFSFLLIEKKQYKELNPAEIFPNKHRYKSTYHDFFELRLIDPVSRRMVYASKYFSFIQNGRVQSYVLYGILFIVAIFIITVLNII